MRISDWSSDVCSSDLVAGVDAAPENVAAARAHAQGSGLEISYHAGELAGLDIGTFDLVTSMEVIEHVADKRAILASLAAVMKPGGLVVLSTPNRTLASSSEGSRVG